MSGGIVEIQRLTPGGEWVRVGDCQNSSVLITKMLEITLRANPQYTKVRAVDAKTKHLIDIAFRS